MNGGDGRLMAEDRRQKTEDPVERGDRILSSMQSAERFYSRFHLQVVFRFRIACVIGCLGLVQLSMFYSHLIWDQLQFLSRIVF